ncbi:MAG: terminase small subunit [Deltaproteobacteria bacterium]|nr:terminase small subunit [Deltaproteobacteria bacterium]
MNSFELELLNQYIGSVNKTISLFTGDIPDDLIQQIDKALKNLGDTWNRCFSGRATFEDFQAALSRLYELYKQGATVCRLPKKRKRSAPSNGKLTQRQRKFIELYIKCGNATKAAQKAGYSLKGVRQTASRNLMKPGIKKAIDKRQVEAERAL